MYQQRTTFGVDDYAKKSEKETADTEVLVDGMTVAAKREKTKLLPELAQMASSGWGAGSTMLQTTQCSTVIEASSAQVARVRKEFPLLDKLDQSNQIKTDALVDGITTAAADSLVKNQMGVIADMIKNGERDMRADTQDFLSTYTTLNDQLRLHAHIGGGEKVTDEERSEMRTRAYAKAWLATQSRVQTGGRLGSVMRTTLGGAQDMWAEMVTCREERLPEELQKNLTAHMQTVKELKVVGLLNTRPLAHLELEGATEVVTAPGRAVETVVTKINHRSHVTTAGKPDTIKMSVIPVVGVGVKVMEREKEKGKVVMEKTAKAVGKGGEYIGRKSQEIEAAAGFFISVGLWLTGGGRVLEAPGDDSV